MLIFIISITTYLWSASIFTNQSSKKSGNVSTGASAIRQSSIDSADASFMDKYFNIKW
jgi:hypothetical protein